MAIAINSLLGVVLVSLALGIFYQADFGLRLAAGMRVRLQAVLGPDFHIHDWVFSIVFLLLGGLALLSAFMRSAAGHYFWVLQ